MKENIPVLLLKKLTLLPMQEVRLELNNDISKKLIDLSMDSYHNKILIILPASFLEESPTITDLPYVGVLATINSKLILPNKNYRVVIKGLNRVKVNSYANTKDKSVLLANVKRLYIDNGESLEQIALKKKLFNLVKLYISVNSESSNSILSKISLETSLDEMTDTIVTFMHFSKDKKIFYMNEFDESKRAKELIKDLNVELEMIKLNNKIDLEIKESFDKEQREYLLKQKIEKLNSELGLTNTKEDEILTFHKQIIDLKADENIKVKLFNELKKYEYTPSNNPEISIIRNYIETLLSLPFNISSKEENNADKIRKALNKTHYGLNEIKERIIEYAILKKKNPNLVNPIICLVGAPGVGKSSIAMSISTSLKREFSKISVGGLNDSSELIGHRRTYLGASPGKIITALIKSKVNNPVILIDEVDKMVKDYKGDPSSTLLDILDYNLNNNFIDNYIEEPFNLNNVLFILTANNEEDIPMPLKDRLEIIHIPSYTIYDKKDIAINYLIPNITSNYNLNKNKIAEDVILNIIKNYTLESGVRELSRVLDKLIRYLIINNLNATKITSNDLNQILGNPIFTSTNKINEVGETNIIGVTPLGGILIKVECAFIPNTSGLIITGNVKEKLIDCINLSINYLKENGYLDSKKYANIGIHYHLCNTNYLIDGRSGTIGLIMALLSLINNKLIDNTNAFIGNIDLYGNTLKVSNLKEKIITAYNNNIKTIYLPSSNHIDENLIPEFILKEINLIYLDNIKEIITLLFKKK
jgi:ATP-dependent Lon protease